MNGSTFNFAKYNERLTDIPFRVVLSFKKIFDYWEAAAADAGHPMHLQAKHTLQLLDHAPELRKPLVDHDQINKYKKELRILLSCIFPEKLTTNEIKAVSMPYIPFFFNGSQRFNTIIDNAGEDYDMMVRDFDHDQVYKVAGQFLLQKKYGVDLMRHRKSLFYDIPNSNTGRMHHYRAFFNGEFSEFKENENFRPLSESEIQQLLDNYDDLDLWKELIPPQSFDFEGFALVTLMDVTRDQALSHLKDRLLEKNVLHSAVSLENLQNHVKDFLNIPDAHLGFLAYDHEAKRVSRLGAVAWGSVLLEKMMEKERRDCFCNHSAKRIFKQKEKFIMSNVTEDIRGKSPLIDSLLDGEIKSAIIAPLTYGDEVIGLVELTSQTKGMLNSLVSDMLDDLLPLFTVALRRTLDDHETKLEAIVQDEFTSIHPSVSWKFFESAEKILQARRKNQKVEPQPIVFKDVVPLFGQFDIRGSSQARNDAIQADLLEQMMLAKNVIQIACQKDDKPIYDHLLHRINLYKSDLEIEINAGDEVKILEFLKQEIYPVFQYLKSENEDIASVVQGYESALDADLKVLYVRRKAYEETVTKINERISDYIEKQEEKAQAMFPHYFEKYNTDGVEYNIYIGQSLMQARDYHPIHLQNLRLWQLIMTVGVERMIHEASEDFEVDLKVASLILAHDNPLAIQFRMDEKQFDVDGAYNIRYEIMKKRIDKAYINNTSERLTQPGKIAIVYSQESEALEYRRYFEYLQQNGYLEEEIEDVTLQDLQGASGLRALRATIIFEKEVDQALDELMQESITA